MSMHLQRDRLRGRPHERSVRADRLFFLAVQPSFNSSSLPTTWREAMRANAAFSSLIGSC